MTTIVTRAGKGSPLTHVEVDTNFTNLNTAKLEAGAIALGSAGTPSISFVSDANTGIFSPGADQVAISTNGSSRLSISNTQIQANALFCVAMSGVGYQTIFRNNPGVSEENYITHGASGFTMFRNHNGTEYMRLDSSGRLGIGTTPDSSLHVVGTSGTGLRIGYTGNTNYFDANTQIFRSNNATTTYGQWDSSGRLLVGTSSDLSGGDADARLQVNGDAGAQILLSRQDFSALTANTLIGEIVFRSQASGVSETSALIKCEADATQGSSDKPGRLVFSTTPDGLASPTERMRINSAGDVSIGAASIPTGTQTGVGFSGALGIGTFSRASDASLLLNTNADGQICRIYRSGTQVGSISVTTTATAFNTSSDYRLKENITEVTDGITRLQQLKPSRFNFIADPDTVVDGFIAHEVQDVVPEAIHGTKDEVDADGKPVHQGIDQSKLVPLLTAALQEAIAKIETLEQRLTAAGID